MLTSIFAMAHQGRRTVAKCFNNCAMKLAYWACSPEQMSHLYDCYKDSHRLAKKMIEVTKSTPAEIGFLLDFFEMRPDGFGSYSDLASFWTKAHDAFPIGCKEREDFPRVFPVLWAARSFDAGFMHLSRPTQFFLNVSLSLSKTLLIKVLESASTQSLLTIEPPT